MNVQIELTTLHHLSNGFPTDAFPTDARWCSMLHMCIRRWESFSDNSDVLLRNLGSDLSITCDSAQPWWIDHKGAFHQPFTQLNQKSLKNCAFCGKWMRVMGLLYCDKILTDARVVLMVACVYKDEMFWRSSSQKPSQWSISVTTCRPRTELGMSFVRKEGGSLW